MSARKVLVTGGSGFIGSGLVKALVKSGAQVRVLDDNSRGRPRRLHRVEEEIEFIGGDIRDADTVAKATQGMDEVHPLAIVNVIDACRKHNVGNLILASSSEGYQPPPVVPTDETAPLSVPDVLNPRYSYGGGKLISELMAINYGRKYFARVLIFRPHNVYGPAMGFEHVVPQFALRLTTLADAQPQGTLRFDIQGTGEETRSFCYIYDLVAGVIAMREKGEHLGIYHVGTMDEVSIADVARRIGRLAARDIMFVPGPLQAGGTPRRCPDISKLQRLGYKPRVSLDEGLKTTVDWYWRNAALAPKK